MAVGATDRHLPIEFRAKLFAASDSAARAYMALRCTPTVQYSLILSTNPKDAA